MTPIQIIRIISSFFLQWRHKVIESMMDIRYLCWDIIDVRKSLQVLHKILSTVRNLKPITTGKSLLQHRRYKRHDQDASYSRLSTLNWEVREKLLLLKQDDHFISTAGNNNLNCVVFPQTFDLLSKLFSEAWIIQPASDFRQFLSNILCKHKSLTLADLAVKPVYFFLNHLVDYI